MKNFYPIGLNVRTNKIAMVTWDDLGNRIITNRTVNPEIKGKIIGGTYWSTGKVVNETNYLEGCNNRYFLSNKQQVFVYKVSYGYLNHPVFVLPDDFKVVFDGINSNNEFPIKVNKKYIQKEANSAWEDSHDLSLKLNNNNNIEDYL